MLSLIGTLSTVMVLITFMVIVVWAWGSKREADFNDAANLVFDAPASSVPNSSRGEKENG